MATTTGPDVVSEGLVLKLDSNNLKSYPGNGTTWFDIANSNNGNINGASFSNNSFSFDGVNDYINCGNKNSLSFTNLLTAQIWCSSINLSSYRSPLMKTSSTSWSNGFGFYQVSNTFAFYINQWNGSQRAIVSKGAFPLTHWVAVYDGSNVKLYENGNLVSTGSAFSSNISNSTANLDIGRGGGGSYYWGGNINEVSLYNIALTSDQVKKNFNSLRINFGI